MKIWQELDHEQKKIAFEREFKAVLEAISEGIPFPEIEEAIDKAVNESESMRTPWFFHEYLMEYGGLTLKKLIIRYAKKRLYAEKQDPYVIYGVL